MTATELHVIVYVLCESVTVGFCCGASCVPDLPASNRLLLTEMVPLKCNQNFTACHYALMLELQVKPGW